MRIILVFLVASLHIFPNSLFINSSILWDLIYIYITADSVVKKAAIIKILITTIYHMLCMKYFHIFFRTVPMYTRVNKNPSAWNFLSPKPEVTCVTVAVIIRVFYFPHICAFVPFLCPPFITINHTAYIHVLTEDDNTFA